MSETHHGSFTFADFRLQNGEVLPEVTIAYCTRGRLASDGRNAVLVTHGYTSGHRMIESGAVSSTNVVPMSRPGPHRSTNSPRVPKSVT